VRVTANARTPEPFTLAMLAKRALRIGREMHGISRMQIARALGHVDDKLVRAWEEEGRSNHVPLWVLMHPNFPASLRAYLLSEAARIAGEAPPHGAESPEAQSMVALRFVGQFISTLSATMADARISADDAAQLLIIGEKTATALIALCARLRQRASTGRVLHDAS